MCSLVKLFGQSFLNPVEERVIVLTASANLLGKVLCALSVALLKRSFPHTEAAGRIVSLGPLTMCLVLMVNLSQPFYQDDLEFGFGSLCRNMMLETPLSRSTLVASASGNSTVHCDWVSWWSCCTWVQFRFMLPVVHVFRAPSWIYIF